MGIFLIVYCTPRNILNIFNCSNIYFLLEWDSKTNSMKRIVQAILAELAKQTIKKHKPKVVAITGSIGKSSTKEAVFTVLCEKFTVRKSVGNLNNEFGIPLTILGHEPPSHTLGWSVIIVKSIINVLFGSKYPEMLVLEFGIDHPGDMVYLCKIAPPDIGIVTAVERVHLEFFRDEGELAHEKEMLLNMLPEGAFALLNYDNERTREMVKRHKELKIQSYGLNKRADVWADDISVDVEGTKCTIHSTPANETLDVSLKLIGKHQIYTVLPAVALGLHLEIPSTAIAKRLMHIEVLKGRMSILDGIYGSTILDSTYNAEPASMLASLETLRTVPAKRKIAILGDMLELGKASNYAHVEIAKKLTGIVSLAILVGPEMLYAYNYLKNLPQNKLSCFHFKSADDVGEFIAEKIKSGDLILVKGSQGIRLEKVSLALLASPETADKVLVRQTGNWLNR